MPEAAAAFDQREMTRPSQRPARDDRQRDQQPRSDHDMDEVQPGQREVEAVEAITVNRDPGGEQRMIFDPLEQDEAQRAAERGEEQPRRRRPWPPWSAGRR